METRYQIFFCLQNDNATNNYEVDAESNEAAHSTTNEPPHIAHNEADANTADDSAEELSSDDASEFGGDENYPGLRENDEPGNDIGIADEDSDNDYIEMRNDAIDEPDGQAMRISGISSRMFFR